MTSPVPIFDAHLHIIDPRFPLVRNQGWLPEPFTVADYRSRVAALPGEVVGGAVVSGSFQGVDQTYLGAALAELGAGWVGVTHLPAGATDEQILVLDSAGVRAARVNLRRGGHAQLDRLENLAQRLFDLAGWHVELYVDAADLVDLEQMLRRLPQVCIDHLGLPDGLDGHGFHALLRLVEHGARVKASGFGRVGVDVAAALRAIAAADAGALVFGTDLPSTRAPRPFASADVTQVLDTLAKHIGRAVLHDNARRLYRLDAPAGLPAKD